MDRNELLRERLHACFSDVNLLGADLKRALLDYQIHGNSTTERCMRLIEGNIASCRSDLAQLIEYSKP